MLKDYWKIFFKILDQKCDFLIQFQPLIFGQMTKFSKVSIILQKYKR